jgi:dTDP-4-dehydrorhamnose 3,5-epimerase
MDGKGVVITGANGQLGRALQALLPSAVAGDRELIDITDKASVDGFDWTGVTVIINAAAYTNVDGAETAEGAELAQKINVDGVANLASVARERDLTLVHISTDYVFDGAKADHLETEDFSPISVYGRTKAEADAIVAGLAKNYLLRTSWVIGDGKNFVRTMLGLGERGIAPNVVDDQFGRLTFADELARAIKYLLETKAEFGVYNMTNAGPVKSWAEITEEIFADAGFDLTVGHISTEQYFAGKENIAPRPRNSDLNLDKLRSVGFEPKDWQNELKNYIDEAKATAPAG